MSRSETVVRNGSFRIEDMYSRLLDPFANIFSLYSSQRVFVQCRIYGQQGCAHTRRGGGREQGEQFVCHFNET